MTLSIAAIRRDSLSLWRFPFCSHVRVFMYEISPVWHWILLRPQETDISAIVLCRSLLRRMCIAENNLALDTPQNKSRPRLLFRAYEKHPNNVEANSWLDWSQTSVRGCRFTFTYYTKSFVPLPPHITEERTSRLDNIICRQISKSSCNV